MTTDIIAKLARVSEKNSSSSDVTGNLCQTKQPNYVSFLGVILTFLSRFFSENNGGTEN